MLVGRSYGECRIDYSVGTTPDPEPQGGAVCGDRTAVATGLVGVSLDALTLAEGEPERSGVYPLSRG